MNVLAYVFRPAVASAIVLIALAGSAVSARSYSGYEIPTPQKSWTDLGGGLAGSIGIPRLSASRPQLGRRVHIRISSAYRFAKVLNGWVSQSVT